MNAAAVEEPRNVLALSSSPRRRGNSRVLAEAVIEGAAEAGHRTKLVQLSDHVQHMLRNCRECRRPDGSCSIEDGYSELFLREFLAADAVVLATPIWWYGMSAHLKNFLDRMFCYYALSYPGHADVQRRMMGKRLALVLSAEESNLAARLGIVHQIQELCRYLHYNFVGVVTGIGNSTAEVRNDPTDPVGSARLLGRRLFEIRETDYKLDVERAPRVWQEGDHYFPTTWR
jgi:multimeric flavodoxin WrbA